MAKRKLLIINKAQFGYHSDTYYYCKYLQKSFDITYLCFDLKKEKIYLDGINTIYLNFEDSIIKRTYNFIKECRKEIKKINYDIIFITYLQGASLIKIGLNSKKFIIDIRTGSIGSTERKRKRNDFIMKIESNYFIHKTIISECLRKKLKISNKNTYILPLGSDVLSKKIKVLNDFRLLYVGVLDSRNIHETVLGIAKFREKNKLISINYDIFGFGTKNIEDKLKETISKNNLNDIVKFHGRKNHNELKYYFDTCNIGISYIPIIDYFDCQPPTKTYEYINSGMYCIGTNTEANKTLITKENGVLCTDTPESFCNSLNHIYEYKDTIDMANIYHTLSEFTWDKIINNKLKPILQQVIKEK